MSGEETRNKRQKNFYEQTDKNFPTRIWYAVRNGILRNVRKNIGVEKEIHQLHLKWLGDLSQKKVLDLGCYTGNSLSYHLAKNSREYTAIDLSEKGITHLSKRIKTFNNAKAIAIDFLSPDFTERNFDLIYAYGVLHHFEDTDNLIFRLKEKLSPNGQIISYDPLQTSWPLKIIRTIYRPFQSDREWEWPFSKQTYFKFDAAFSIKERRAILGKAKWFFLLSLLPVSSTKKTTILKKWHVEDWEKSLTCNHHMFRCMHLTMLMGKK